MRLPAAEGSATGVVTTPRRTVAHRPQEVDKGSKPRWVISSCTMFLCVCAHLLTAVGVGGLFLTYHHLS